MNNDYDDDDGGGGENQNDKQAISTEQHTGNVDNEANSNERNSKSSTHKQTHTHTNSNRATKQPIDNLTTRVGNEKATRRRHQKSRGCANV
ncbi:hypothetical protein T09_5905 [Trichinella sp. T9]|nr:hypothetical protein T09_5905 [Trichinella sp. T9]